ncbi:MAG TPA: thaumarchaeosortase [Nitrososphaera sp.]|nr:thaumarchaeosortase [Nitrososphaera sp.]
MSRDKTVASDGSEGHVIFGISSSIAATLILISPILYTLVAYPDTFILSWNEGRGGFLFAMAFIGAELVGLKYSLAKKRLLMVAVMAALTISYFIALPYGLSDYIRNGKDAYNVSLVDSWMWMWDFIVMAIFVASSLLMLFGKKWYKIASAGMIYLAGSALILALDAFFPFDSLGPLQIIVPIYLQIDQAVINFIDTCVINVGPQTPNNSAEPALARGNLLVMNGLHGPFALQVFWPSAGVHSMIIYTLVMLALLIKMDMPLPRKLIYFAAGTLGTVATNLVRIVSLSLYALVVTTDIQEWEAFHSIAGEIMFLPWLGIYLGVVIYIENKRIRRLQAEAGDSAASNQSTR